MSIRLKRVEPYNQYGGPLKALDEQEVPDALRAVYLVRHNGPRTSVWNELVLETATNEVPASWVARMTIETAPMESGQAAVDKMADWLERLARGMRDGKVLDGFPLAMAITPKPGPLVVGELVRLDDPRLVHECDEPACSLLAAVAPLRCESGTEYDLEGHPFVIQQLAARGQVRVGGNDDFFALADNTARYVGTRLLADDA